MKTINRVEEEKGPNAVVEIVAATAKIIKLGTLLQQLGSGQIAAKLIQRLVADGRIGRSDEMSQVQHLIWPSRPGVPPNRLVLHRGRLHRGITRVGP